MTAGNDWLGAQRAPWPSISEPHNADGAVDLERAPSPDMFDEHVLAENIRAHQSYGNTESTKPVATDKAWAGSKSNSGTLSGKFAEKIHSENVLTPPRLKEKGNRAVLRGAKEKRICGIKRNIFILLILLIVAIVVGAAVGGAIGGRNAHSSSSNSAASLTPVMTTPLTTPHTTTDSSSASKSASYSSTSSSATISETPSLMSTAQSSSSSAPPSTSLSSTLSTSSHITSDATQLTLSSTSSLTYLSSPLSPSSSPPEIGQDGSQAKSLSSNALTPSLTTSSSRMSLPMTDLPTCPLSGTYTCCVSWVSGGITVAVQNNIGSQYQNMQIR
ncbi:hypothetical protein V1509DRAFT_100884 [Lipomyces kononenkoae]